MHAHKPAHCSEALARAEQSLTDAPLLLVTEQQSLAESIRPWNLTYAFCNNVVGLDRTMDLYCERTTP